MSQHDQQHKKNFQLERIALFSDAVFAIAITLLIIEIKVPDLPAIDPEFSEAFWHSLNHMIPELAGFVISFMVIGNYWKSHHSTFYFVQDYDLKLINMNNWFLLTIVVMPFTTAFMSTYMLFQPFLLYCVNVIASALLQIRMWNYVTHEEHHLHTALPKGIKSYKTTTSLIIIACFVIALIIHKLPFLHGNFGGFAARMFLVSIYFINMFMHRYYRKKYQLSDKY